MLYLFARSDACTDFPLPVGPIKTTRGFRGSAERCDELIKVETKKRWQKIGFSFKKRRQHPTFGKDVCFRLVSVDGFSNHLVASKNVVDVTMMDDQTLNH